MTDEAKPRPLPFTIEDLRAWLWPQVEAGMVDAYTGRRLTLQTVTFDHKTPVSRGGSLGLENIALCSEIENRGKADLTEEEWRFLKSAIEQMPESAQSSIYRRLRTKPAMITRLQMELARRNHPAGKQARPPAPKTLFDKPKDDDF